MLCDWSASAAAVTVGRGLKIPQLAKWMAPRSNTGIRNYNIPSGVINWI